MPTYDVSEAVAIAVNVDIATMWDVLMEVDLIEVGRNDTTSIPLDEGGWVLLGDRPRDEIALGLVGKFWRPVIEFAKVPAARFRDFAEPGFAKTIYSLSVCSLDDHRTLLAGVMRTATTDERARRWFRRYWTFRVGAGAHILVSGLLDVTRETAEARAGVPN